ncbi:MAG: hypothetical protein ACK4SO_05350 [Candidatus Kapaibacteriota bacterium]
MEKEAEDFLQAEESAKMLLQALTELYDEANSYKIATETLEAVRLRLLDLIETTNQYVTVHIEILNKLRALDFKSLDLKVDRLNSTFGEKLLRVSDELNSINFKIKNINIELVNGIQNLEKSTLGEFESFKNYSKNAFGEITKNFELVHKNYENLLDLASSIQNLEKSTLDELEGFKNYTMGAFGEVTKNFELIHKNYENLLIFIQDRYIIFLGKYEQLKKLLKTVLYISSASFLLLIILIFIKSIL